MLRSGFSGRSLDLQCERGREGFYKGRKEFWLHLLEDRATIAGIFHSNSETPSCFWSSEEATLKWTQNYTRLSFCWPRVCDLIRFCGSKSCSPQPGTTDSMIHMESRTISCRAHKFVPCTFTSYHLLCSGAIQFLEELLCIHTILINWRIKLRFLALTDLFLKSSTATIALTFSNLVVECILKRNFFLHIKDYETFSWSLVI